MRYALALWLVFGFVAVATAQDAAAPTPPGLIAQAVGGQIGVTREAPYVGGRGLITDELATGMFLNPTSGTLRQFEFTLQYCALIFHAGDQTAVGHGAIAGFGITDWLEVGAQGLLVDLPGNDDNPTVGGPQLRVRVLKDEAWHPEVSVGGIFLFGDEVLEKNTAYVALSKGLRISDTGPIRGVRGHAGFRQAWIEVGEDQSIGFFGAELELPKHIFIVAEVSTKDGGLTKTPWAAGIQVRHPDGFGLTLAIVQTGTLTELGVYVGVGINF